MANSIQLSHARCADVPSAFDQKIDYLGNICIRPQIGCSTNRLNQTPAACARQSSDANTTAVARRDTECLPQILPAYPLDAAARAVHCTPAHAADRHAAHFNLQSLDRGIDIPSRVADGRFFSQHVPRFQRPPQFDLDAVVRDLPEHGKTKFEMRSEPILFQRIAGRLQFVDNFLKILRHKVRQHKSIVQRGAPPHQRRPIRLQSRTATPTSASAVAVSGSSCACGGISNARNSTSPNRPWRVSGENSLSMQNSARCVLPVTSISKFRSTRSTIHGDCAPCSWQLRERCF